VRSLSKFAACAVVIVFAVALAGCEDESNGDGSSNGGEPSMAFAENCQKTDEKQFDSAPANIIDTDKTYVATIKTAKGDIVIELDSSRELTTNNFVFLACKGFYDGLTFHRVEPNFVIQGGDPAGNGSGGPGYTIPGDFGGEFVEGTLGMARSQDPDSAGSQFYIVIGQASHLNGQYTAFGKTTSGLDVAKMIAVGDVMESVTIEER
jgi:cyclophilin family peptidyl-prolyl cis-trans isomerase